MTSARIVVSLAFFFGAIALALGLAYSGDDSGGVPAPHDETHEFINLSDTPPIYAGHEGQCVEVADPPVGLVFEPCAADTHFTDLLDTPNDLSPGSGEYLRVNTDGDGIIFATITPGTSGLPTGGQHYEVLMKGATGDAPEDNQWAKVSSPNLNDAAVTNAKIADDAITNAKIAAGAVSQGELDTLVQSRLAPNPDPLTAGDNGCIVAWNESRGWICAEFVNDHGFTWTYDASEDEWTLDSSTTGGLSAVATDSTLTGDGTAGDPLKVANPGGTYRLPARLADFAGDLMGDGWDQVAGGISSASFASAPSLAQAAAATFVNRRTQGTSGTNLSFALRLPTGTEFSAAQYRVRGNADDEGDPERDANADRPGSAIVSLGTSGSFDYYRVLVPDLPAGVRLELQELDPLEVGAAFDVVQTNLKGVDEDSTGQMILTAGSGEFSVASLPTPYQLPQTLADFWSDLAGGGWRQVAGGVAPALYSTEPTWAQASVATYANRRTDATGRANYWMALRLPADTPFGDGALYRLRGNADDEGDPERDDDADRPGKDFVPLSRPIGGAATGFDYYAVQIPTLPAGVQLELQSLEPLEVGAAFNIVQTNLKGVDANTEGRVVVTAGNGEFSTAASPSQLDLEQGPGVRIAASGDTRTISGRALSPTNGAALPSGLLAGELFYLTAPTSSARDDRLFDFRSSQSNLVEADLSGVANGWSIVGYDGEYTGLGQGDLRSRVFVWIPSTALTNRPNMVALYRDGETPRTYNVEQNAVTGLANPHLIIGFPYSNFVDADGNLLPGWRINLIGGSAPEYTAAYAAGLYQRGGVGQAAWVRPQWLPTGGAGANDAAHATLTSDLSIAAATSTFGAWSEVWRYTAGAAAKISAAVSGEARPSWSATDGADRGVIEFRVRRMNSANAQQDVLIAAHNIYLRNPNFALGYATSSVGLPTGYSFGFIDDLAAGDYLLVEARGAAQKPASGKTISILASSFDATYRVFR